MLSHDDGHRERERIQINGHSASDNLNDFGASSIFTLVCADTASLVSPAHAASREIASNTVATVICDAGGHRSANSA